MEKLASDWLPQGVMVGDGGCGTMLRQQGCPWAGTGNMELGATAIYNIQNLSQAGANDQKATQVKALFS